MSEEGFLSRWSRRKRAIEAGRELPEPEAPPPATVAAAAPPPAVVTPPTAAAPEEPEFDPASLPPVESLTIESDITAFLRKGVPESLKRAALRRAWSLDPAIRDFVGPADYAWDFNAPDGVPGFALDLPGDVKELLAQVFRPAEPEEAPAPAELAEAAPETRPEAPEAPPPPALAAVAPPAEPE
ncbi:DUF3306 domain-containing protein, partial [Neoroseomonas rubea]|uniref:DUF3306 domain-containing protein n=1 Tax=Neoroseomonas rubea TaxID=2748666 RepID=UPI0018DF56EC